MKLIYVLLVVAVLAYAFALTKVGTNISETFSDVGNASLLIVIVLLLFRILKKLEGNTN